MLRYYPSFRIKKNLVTNGSEYRTAKGPYRGKYYLTYDGRKFTGPNPTIGPNEELFDIRVETSSDFLNSTELPASVKNEFIQKSGNSIRPIALSTRGTPTPYFPIVTEEDYRKGYVLRSFVKKVNDRGFVTEISNEEYANIQNGDVNYDVSDYLTLQILWKLTGPLNSIRLSQYDTKVGIIDTNKRLVENANKTFLGIVDYIAGEYSKYARPS